MQDAARAIEVWRRFVDVVLPSPKRAATPTQAELDRLAEDLIAVTSSLDASEKAMVSAQLEVLAHAARAAGAATREQLIRQVAQTCCPPASSPG
jgi:hypothetical protein